MTEKKQAWYSRSRVNTFVHSPRIQYFIIAVILVNAATLGFETSPTVMATAGDVLHLIDKICLGIFIVELLLKMYALRLAFFKSAWNVFDFLVVGVALVPGADGFAVLRALRVLRVLRLISVVPALRRVVDALVRALPGIASIAALLVIVFYVGGVMATMLFGQSFPNEFGSLTSSLFSLFQIMTLDNWSVIARMVTDEIAWAPAFFVPFVLISALTVLNLFIAVIVDAMQGLDKDKEKHTGEEPRHTVAIGDTPTQDVASEVAALRAQIAALTAEVKRSSAKSE